MIKISKNIISSLVVFLLMVSFALSLSLPSRALADSGKASYAYLLGVEPLCGLGPTACPTVAKAANGDTVELTGSGVLSVHEKSVSGGGTFVHKDESGATIGAGSWVAAKLMAFDSYGCGGGGLPSNFCGGRAQLIVHLTAVSGAEFDGLLWVDCTLAKFPRGANEGVRLNVMGINFNKEVSGFTLFVKLP